MSSWLDDRVASHAPQTEGAPFEPSNEVWLDDRLGNAIEKPAAEAQSAHQPSDLLMDETPCC